jgi:two-component system secretion response regulator SsrB
VLLAEPHHGLAEGVRALLASVADAVVMVADRASLFEAAGRLAPALAVVELGLGKPDVGSFLQGLRARCPGLPVIFISVYDETTVAQSVIAAGADAFVVKRDLGTKLLPQVEGLLRSPRCRA